MEENTEHSQPDIKVETNKAPKPRWQKDFESSDYNQFLLIANQRTDKEALNKTLGNIQERLLNAELQGMLPPEERPTNIARNDFIEVPNANLLIGRVNALRGVAMEYGRRQKGNRTLKYRIAQFESKDIPLDVSGQNDKGVIFSTVTKFPDSMIGVRMTGDHKFSVNVDFKKKPYEQQTPDYRSGFLPTERLTSEEIRVLAQHALEVGFYTMMGDPSKSPYPWDNPSATQSQ